jgi:uncharacterized protein
MQTKFLNAPVQNPYLALQEQSLYLHYNKTGLMPYALIAGGSKGIGYAIAEALAKRAYDLILVGRDITVLETAKKELNEKYNINIEILEADLSKTETAEKIFNSCVDKKWPVNFLCNVAGLGGNKDFLKLPLEDLRYMVDINLMADISMCLKMLPILKTNAPSYILNVSSMAGFAPIPEKNVYAATKSAVIFFSYSLRQQLKNDNIIVSCLCPGPVFTKPEIVKTTIEKLGWFGKQMAVKPEIVGEIAVKNTLAGKMIIVPGKLAKLMSVLLRVLPKKLLTFIYSGVK